MEWPRNPVITACHLEWHMLQRLRSFFAKDGKGADRRWAVKGVIDRLVQIQCNRVSLQGVEFDQVTEADDEQKEILTLLKSAT